MIFRGKGSGGDLSGFLDQGSHFEGDLRFEQSFRVDGKVTGTVRSEGDLVVGEHGEIEGEIAVGRLFVSGRVRGEVRIGKRLSIHRGGRVEGDVRAAALVVEEGGILEGQCAMGEQREAESGDATAIEPLPSKVVGRIAAGGGGAAGGG
jgi:cytoskeletal protein CcmA (bactofilin family)